jgi:CPA2 family monovalent cation:H+ antiporter-2
VASLIPEGEETQFLGEIGIVFMMFSIGLEFSLPKLRAMRHLVFGLGLAQVVVTLSLIALVMGWLTGSACPALPWAVRWRCRPPPLSANC